MRSLSVFLTVLALALTGCSGASPRSALEPPRQDECVAEPQPLSCAANADARAARER